MKLLNQILNKISSTKFNQVHNSLGALYLIASSLNSDSDILNSFCVLAFDEIPNRNFTLKEYINRKADAKNGLSLIEKHLIAKEVSKLLKDASAFYDVELKDCVKVDANFKQPNDIMLVKIAKFGTTALIGNKCHLVNPLTNKVTAEYVDVKKEAAPTMPFADSDNEIIYENSDYVITLTTMPTIPENLGDTAAFYTIKSNLGKGTRGGIVGQCVVVVNETGYALQGLKRYPEELEPSKLSEDTLMEAYSIVQKDYESRIADTNKYSAKKEQVEKKAEEKIDFEKDLMEAGESEGAKDKVNETQLAMGKEVEKEHTTNPEIAEKITRDHLAEIPDYYTHLKEMEDNAKTNDAVEKKADATDSKDGYTLEEGNDYYQIFKNNEKGTFRIWDINGNGWEDTQEYTDIASAEKEIENLAEGLPEKLEDGVVNSDDKEEKQGIKYSVNLWPGNGYQTKEFKAYATSEEDALDNVVQYLVDNDLDQYFLTEEDVKRMAAEEGISEDELKDKPAFNEKYMYIDTGMGAQVYLLTENMKINKDVSEVKSSYAPFTTVDASEEGAYKIYSGDHFIGTCKTITAAFEKVADWSSEEMLIDDGTGVTVTYQTYDDESKLPVVWAALRHRDNGNVIMCSDAVYVDDLVGAEDHIDFLKDITDFSKEFEKVGLDEEKVQHYQDQTNAKLKEIFQPKPEASAKPEVKKEAGESYGWVVNSEDAWDKLTLWEETVGAEQALRDVAKAMGDEELSECLAYIFRMNDFKEGCSDTDDEDSDVESAKKENVEKTAERDVEHYSFNSLEELIDFLKQHGIDVLNAQIKQDADGKYILDGQFKTDEEIVEETGEEIVHSAKEENIEKKAEEDNEYHVEIYTKLDADENPEGFDAERYDHNYFKTLEEAKAWAEKLTNKKNHYYEISLNDEVVESSENDINKKADQELKQFDMKQELDGQKEFEKQDDFSQVSVPEEKEDTSEVTETMEAKPEETKGESFSASEFGNNLAYIQQNNPDAFKSIMNNLKQIMVGDQQKIYNFLENWASHNFQDFTAMTREDPSYARHSQYQEQLKNNVLPKLKEMSEYKQAMEEKVSAEKGNVESAKKENIEKNAYAESELNPCYDCGEKPEIYGPVEDNEGFFLRCKCGNETETFKYVYDAKDSWNNKFPNKTEKGESTKYGYDSSDPEDDALYNHNGEDEGEED